MAFLEKRGKTWRAGVSIKTIGGYKRKPKSGFRTKAEAQAWANEMETAKAKGFVNMSKDQLLTDYFHEWYTTYKTGVAPATLKWYVNVEKYISEYLPNVLLSELTRPTFQRFINQLGERYSTETVRKARSIMHQAIKSAMYDELIFKEPIEGIKAVGKDGKSADLKYLEEPQMKALVDYIQASPAASRDASDVMILLALNTGARYEELAALTWVNLNPGGISINKAWTNSAEKSKSPKQNHQDVT
jgi:integrase